MARRRRKAQAAAVKRTSAAEPGKKTICLNMIVKDESAVIERCLRSVRDWIDYWVICDTGSTDATPEIVKRCLEKVPGELHARPWVNFGHNRTEACRLAAGKADYLLFVDADMECRVHGPFKPTLDRDAYYVRYEGSLDYSQPLLVRDGLDWRFVGATHEYLHSPCKEISWGGLSDLTVRHHCDGGTRQEKLSRDLALLTRQLQQNPGDGRSMYYLAQTYREMGQLETALNWYTRRAKAGGWPEEVWHALYQRGKLMQELGRPWIEVLDALLDAYQFRPTRAEPLYHVIHRYRLRECYQAAWAYARKAIQIPYPTDRLFVERPVYEYLIPLEYAICCFYVGDHREAVRHNRSLADHEGVPAQVRERALANLRFSLEVGRAPDDASPDGSADLRDVKIYALAYDKDALGGSPISLRAMLERLVSLGAKVCYKSRAPSPDRLAAWSPDLIVSQQWATGEARALAGRLGVPFVMCVHGPGQFEHFFNRAEDCGLAVFNSFHQERLVKARHPGLNSVVLHPIVRRIPGGSKADAQDRITMVGSEGHKGTALFLKLVRTLPAERFLWVANHRERTLPWNLEVIPPGRDIDRVYARTKLLLMPSRAESYGRVAVEAAFHGIPTVASDLPGPREAAEHDLMVFVKPPGSLHHWRQTVVAALTDLPTHARRAERLSGLKDPDAEIGRVADALRRLLVNRRKQLPAPPS